MKRVLLITYYWPPSGGSGVQRWLKTVRYLRDFGYESVVYTALNAEYPVTDKSLEEEVPEGLEVIRTPIWEPYNLYKRFIGQKKEKRVVSGFLSEDKKPSLTARISMWIRGNLFIPDARKYWIRPSVSYLKKYLKENPVDLIVSTGPPHTTHLIALGLYKKIGIPWVADFRDPWTNISFYKDLMLSSWADRKHHRLEKEVVITASRVVVVGNQMAKEFAEIGNRKIDVITNGYDEADLPTILPEPDAEFSLVHIGMLSDSQNHEILWQALGELSLENEVFAQALKIRLIGKVDVGVHAFLDKYQLKDQTEIIDYISHSEAIEAQRKAQVLLLLINNSPNAKGVITGKIFEYLASSRPVIAIGPENGDAAAIIKNVNAGAISGFNDKESLKRNLLNYFEYYQAGELEAEGVGVEAYSRRTLTGVFAKVFDEITT